MVETFSLHALARFLIHDFVYLKIADPDAHSLTSMVTTSMTQTTIKDLCQQGRGQWTWTPSVLLTAPRGEYVAFTLLIILMYTYVVALNMRARTIKTRHPYLTSPTGGKKV